MTIPLKKQNERNIAKLCLVVKTMGLDGWICGSNTNFFVEGAVNRKLTQKVLPECFFVSGIQLFHACLVYMF